MAIPLKRAFATSLTLAVLLALALFEPHLEFTIFDVLETMHLPAPMLGTLAFYGEIFLILLTVALGIAVLVRRSRNRA